MPAGDDAGPGGSTTFTCPHYDPVPGGKRCRQYLEGGACARPDEFMCIEWLKANGHPVPPPAATTEPTAAPPDPQAGVPVDAPLFGRLTDEHIASFKALGAEACIGLAGGGSLWLVPEYRDPSRDELSAEHAATLAALCAVFPGARILSFGRPAAAERRPPRGGRSR